MGISGQIFNQFHLIRLVLFLHEGNRLLTGQFKPLQLQLFLADFAHFCLQRSQMLRREGKGCIKIIVEAIVDRRADGQLHLGVQTLDRLRQHMGAGVPIGLAVFLVFKGIDVFFAHVSSSF